MKTLMCLLLISLITPTAQAEKAKEEAKPKYLLTSRQIMDLPGSCQALAMNERDDEAVQCAIRVDPKYEKLLPH